MQVFNSVRKFKSLLNITSIYLKTVLSNIFKEFGNKSFIKFHANGFEQYPVHNEYKKMEESFLTYVR